MPSEIQTRFPDLWKDEGDEGSKNNHEKEFLEDNLQRTGKEVKSSYTKVTSLSKGKKLVESFKNLMSNDLNVVVYNFVDMLSHARTDMEVIRELADDESAYRSLTLSWFEHSPLLEVIRQISENQVEGTKLIITSDHGTMRVKEPSKVIGDRNTSTNLRYKQGKNLKYESKDVFEITDPVKGRLPQQNVSTKYIFAKQDKFFAYPNNYNYYVNYFRNTFQHGGISMEEVLVPFVTMSLK